MENVLRRAGAPAVGRLVADLADIAVVVSQDGIVADVPHVGDRTAPLFPRSWRGQPFGETMLEASRDGAADLLDDLRRGAPAGNREVLHPLRDDETVLVRYRGAALDGGSDCLLLGQAIRPDGATREVDFEAIFAQDVPAGSTDTQRILADLLRFGGDLVVVTDAGGRILWANDAFLSLAEVSVVMGAGGRFLEDLFEAGNPVDLGGLMELAGSSRLFPPVAATLRGDAGRLTPVTLGLTRLPRTAPPLYGAIMRPAVAGALPMPALQDVTGALEQVGRVPLKGLVRETAERVERHCLRAALSLSGGNRSAAARALGISRQALYLKLERHDLLDA